MIVRLHGGSVVANIEELRLVCLDKHRLFAFCPLVAQLRIGICSSFNARRE
jgi:hypothetical protein